MPHPRFAPREGTLSTHWTGGWVGLRAGLYTEIRGKISCLCQGFNIDCPVVQSVARHYTDWATRLISLWRKNINFKCLESIWSKEGWSKWRSQEFKQNREEQGRYVASSVFNDTNMERYEWQTDDDLDNLIMSYLGEEENLMKSLSVARCTSLITAIIGNGSVTLGWILEDLTCKYLPRRTTVISSQLWEPHISLRKEAVMSESQWNRLKIVYIGVCDIQSTETLISFTRQLMPWM
jgi:hypothetical protein